MTDRAVEQIWSNSRSIEIIFEEESCSSFLPGGSASVEYHSVTRMWLSLPTEHHPKSTDTIRREPATLQHRTTAATNKHHPGRSTPSTPANHLITLVTAMLFGLLVGWLFGLLVAVIVSILTKFCLNLVSYKREDSNINDSVFTRCCIVVVGIVARSFVEMCP